MANINLSRSGQHSEKSTPFLGAAFMVSVGLLGAVVAAYFGLLSYNTYAGSRMDALRTSIEASKATLSSPDAVKVTDFSRRSEEVDKHLKTVVIPSDTLDKLEKTILPDVVLTEYAYAADGTIKLMLRTNAMKNVAQQLLALKKNFSSVTAGNISTDETGSIRAEVTMTDTVVTAQ